MKTAPVVILNEEGIHTSVKVFTLVRLSYVMIGTTLKQFVHKPSTAFFEYAICTTMTK